MDSTRCTLLGLASFAQCHIYKDHTTACSCSFVILIADILLHKYTIIFIHSIVDRHLNCFHLVILMKNIAVNICVEVFV